MTTFAPRSDIKNRKDKMLKFIFILATLKYLVIAYPAKSADVQEDCELNSYGPSRIIIDRNVVTNRIAEFNWDKLGDFSFLAWNDASIDMPLISESLRSAGKYSKGIYEADENTNLFRVYDDNSYLTKSSYELLSIRPSSEHKTPNSINAFFVASCDKYIGLEGYHCRISFEHEDVIFEVHIGNSDNLKLIDRIKSLVVAEYVSNTD